jgi:hypothetical protein
LLLPRRLRCRPLAHGGPLLLHIHRLLLLVLLLLLLLLLLHQPGLSRLPVGKEVHALEEHVSTRCLAAIPEKLLGIPLLRLTPV